MAPKYFPLRWESTGDEWWFACPIDWAAANGHYDLVRELLNMDPNLLIKLTSLRRIRRLETLWDDEQELNGVAICRAKVARKLLYESETTGKSSLMRAGYGGWLVYSGASAGDLEFVKELLSREPMLVLGEGEYGVTDVFYAAARSKNSQLLRLLIDYCVATKGVGDKETTNVAVHAAARGGNVEILRELLLGINCEDDVLCYRDDQGATLLHSASGRGQVEVVKSLLASYDISSSRDKLGNTALHVAAYRGYLSVVEVIISASSSSSASLKNDHGDTFLHMAVAGFSIPSFRRLDRQIELMKQLVSGKFVNIEDIINVRNNDGKTALHVAVMDNIRTDLVELLMTVPSIDLNIRDAQGNTPLDLLKQRYPQSASSQILIKRFLSAGGIMSNFEDRVTTSDMVSNIRTQFVIGSPGTSFRISDVNVCDTDNASSGLDEMSPCHSIAGSSSSHSKKLPLGNSAARRLKILLQRAWRKEAIKKGIDNMDYKDESVESYTQCLSLAEKPIPLRHRFSTTPSRPDNQETPYSPSLPSASPSSKKKFGGTPRLSFGSPLSAFSGSSWASPACMTSQEKSGELKLFKNGEKSKMKRKYNSLNMRVVNKYLCFGAQGLAMDHPNSSQDQFYKHEVVA